MAALAKSRRIEKIPKVTVKRKLEIKRAQKVTRPAASQPQVSEARTVPRVKAESAPKKSRKRADERQALVEETKSS